MCVCAMDVCLHGCIPVWMNGCMHTRTYVSLYVYAMKIAYDIHHAKTFRCSHSVSFGIIPGICVRAHGDGQRTGDALETVGLQETL